MTGPESPGLQGAMEPIGAPAPELPKQQEKQLSALSSTLKWSSLLALVDLCSIAIDPVACLGSTGLTAIFTVQMTLCFWIPRCSSSERASSRLFDTWRRAVLCWGPENDKL